MVSNDYSMALFEDSSSKARVEVMIREYSVGEFLWKEAFNPNSVISRISAQTLCAALSQINKLIDIKYSRQHTLIHPDCKPHKIERNVVLETGGLFEITTYYSKDGEVTGVTKEKIYQV